MQHSDSIVNLANAIVLAQSEISAVVENKENPFLKSKYADLGAVIEAIRPSFEKYGLAVVQFPFGSNNEIGVETILLHSSGEWISERASMSMSEEKGKTDAQVVGSIVSYLRRYGISSIARIYTEDNDGQTMRGNGNRQQNQNTRVSQSSVPVASGNTQSQNRQNTNAQTTAINAQGNSTDKKPVSTQTTTPARTHPPLSSTQRNKLVELWSSIHEGSDVAANEGLEKLFVETFKHGMDDATYEEGARLTGQLLAEMREKANSNPAASTKTTSENGQTTTAQETQGDTKTRTSNIGNAKQIRSATCPVHLSTTILWEKDGKQKWGHVIDGTKEWCWEQVPAGKTI